MGGRRLELGSPGQRKAHPSKISGERFAFRTSGAALLLGRSKQCSPTSDSSGALKIRELLQAQGIEQLPGESWSETTARSMEISCRELRD
jgi:hypothetical protein